MNGRTVFLLLGCLPTLISAAPAQSLPSQVKPQNIVTVSFNAAVLQTAEAQKSIASLQTRFAPKEEQLKTLNAEVETLRKQLTAGSTWSDAERATREQSLESKEKQLQREAEDFKTDSQTESEQILQKIAQKLYAFLQTYSQQHGYAYVIERGSDANPVVWYAAANLDITGDLIKAYNAQTTTASPIPTSKPAATLPQTPSRN